MKRRGPENHACLFIIVVLLGVAGGGPAGRVHAQPSEHVCNQLTQAVALYESLHASEPDVWISIATSAREARQCYGEAAHARRVWLLDEEVGSLEKLGRRGEAEALVDLFYRELFEEASAEYRARFAMHRFRLSAARRDFIRAALAHQEAAYHRSVLPVAMQAQHMLDGVSLYRHTGALDRALHDARTVEAFTKQDSTLTLAHGHALLVKSEVRLDQQHPPDSVVVVDLLGDLKRARRIFEAEGAVGQAIRATVDQGRAWAVLGYREQAEALFQQAMVEACARDATPALIFAYLHRGRARVQQGELAPAQADFEAGLALAESSGVRQYDYDVLLSLAGVQEAQDAFATASRLYRRALAVDGAPVDGWSGMVRRSGERGGMPGWLWAGLGLVLAAVIAGVPLRRRAGVVLFQRVARRASGGGLPGHVEHDLLRQRLAKIQWILKHPKAAAQAVDDPVLREQLIKGIATNADLFRCMAVLEEQAAGKMFENNPANTVGRYLREAFKEHHWPWPLTPEAWRRWFKGRT